jgi:hypothetical protein
MYFFTLPSQYNVSNYLQILFIAGWAGHVACKGEERKMYRVLAGKPEGKRPLGRPRHRWDDGIRIDLRETGWGSVDGSSWLRIGAGGRPL